MSRFCEIHSIGLGQVAKIPPAKVVQRK